MFLTSPDQKAAHLWWWVLKLDGVVELDVGVIKVKLLFCSLGNEDRYSALLLRQLDIAEGPVLSVNWFLYSKLGLHWCSGSNQLAAPVSATAELVSAELAQLSESVTYGIDEDLRSGECMILYCCATRSC